MNNLKILKILSCLFAMLIGASCTPQKAYIPIDNHVDIFMRADAYAPNICHKEITADDVRRLQSLLTISALHCQHDPQVSQEITIYYNFYVKKYGKEMLAYSKILENAFKKYRGKKYMIAYDQYITALANDFSKQSTTNPHQFCQAALIALQDLEKRPAASFGEYAMQSNLTPKLSVANNCR